MSNMEENNQQQIDALMEQAVEKAVATPAPVQEEKRLPYLHEQLSSGFHKGLRNLFRTGEKSKKKRVPKLDADGKEIPHGNQGIVYVWGQGE